MNQITKVSDITAQDIADYLRISELTTSETNFINACLEVAKDYICKYTGVDSASLDSYTDFVIVVFVLCQDMYDNRTNYVDSGNPNIVVDTILGLHQRNLL